MTRPDLSGAHLKPGSAQAACVERNISETNAFYRYVFAFGFFLLTWDAIPFLYQTPYLGLGVGIGLGLVALMIATGATRKCPAWALLRLPVRRARATQG